MEANAKSNLIYLINGSNRQLWQCCISAFTSGLTAVLLSQRSVIYSPSMVVALLRARNFLFNSLVPWEKDNVYFASLNGKTTCPKIDNHNNTKG